MSKFLNLIKLELTRILKSKIHWLFVIAFMIFSVSQTGAILAGSDNTIRPPDKEDYENYNFEDLRLDIMTDKIGSLGYDFTHGSYYAAPLGITKQVRLGKEDTLKVEHILEELIGLKKQEFVKWFKDYNKCRRVVTDGDGSNSVPIMKNIPPAINPALTWNQFLKAMEKVSGMIGKGSDYSRNLIEEKLASYKSYEDAVTDYNDLLHQDKILGAVARWLSDYFGIMLAFLPVIIGVYLVHEDKRKQICEIIYSKKISSVQLIYSRYAAALISIMIVVLIAMFIPNTVIGLKLMKNGYEIDLLAFAKYSFGWLMPTVMMSLAVGFFISELFSGIAAIMVQFLWFYTSVFLYMGPITGYVGKQIIPRFNTFGEYHKFESLLHELVLNRICYSIASIGIIALTAILYACKRRGKMDVKTIFYRNQE